MKALGNAFIALSFALQTACPVSLEEFDREPVVKSVIGGPLKARFYASPASDGGAATRFRVGETIYLVDTLENTTGREQPCEVGEYPHNSCDSSHALYRDKALIWTNQEPLGIPCGEEIPLLKPPVSLLIPENLLLRRFETLPIVSSPNFPDFPLRPGVYRAEWRRTSALWDLCEYSAVATTVSLQFSVLPAEE